MRFLHKYFRAIGFSKLKKRAELEQLIKICAKDATKRAYTSLNDETMLAIFCKDFAPGIGVAICGEYDENNNFSYDYCYPYLIGEGISSYEEITIERHAEKESYAGVCDDIKVGVSLIFYLLNMISYLKVSNSNRLPMKGTSLTLSGLSCQGTVMMPIVKNEIDKKKTSRATKSRNQLIEAARKGDEEAIESLTLEDMDTYTAISKMIHKEDVFSIVDNYFMPYGVECDQYSILGEIQNTTLLENILTKEHIYKLSICCNELVFDICINQKDLYGEPAVGRRFKGTIWLQGVINFPENG